MSFASGFEKEAGLKHLGLAGLMSLSAIAHGADKPTPEIRALIDRKAAQHGVDPQVLEGLVFAESSFNPRKINPENGAPPSRRSLGLAQVQPRTAKWLGFKGTRKELMHPENNLEYASKYLAKQLKRYRGSYPKALSAYNAGRYVPRNAKNAEYVRKILKYKR